jgi:hypothetical protein
MIFNCFFNWLQIYIDKVLQRKPSALSFYVFEGEEREEFVEIIGNF